MYGSKRTNYIWDSFTNILIIIIAFMNKNRNDVADKESKSKIEMEINRKEMITMIGKVNEKMEMTMQ